MLSAAAPTRDALPARDAHWTGMLHAGGRRVTKQRLAVLTAVEHAPHAAAEEILTAVRGPLPDITIQSVYVVLMDLTGIGLLRKIDPPGSPSRYETRTGDNHHHAVCTGCGRIEDVDCAVGHAPCLTPSNTGGMQIEVAEVLFRGLCTNCRAKIPPSS